LNENDFTHTKFENGAKNGAKLKVGTQLLLYVQRSTDATYVEVSMSSYEMGKLLPVQRTVWVLRVRRVCTVLYESGETTKRVPNKPLNT
jgi:hypothetical protein